MESGNKLPHSKGAAATAPPASDPLPAPRSALSGPRSPRPPPAEAAQEEAGRLIDDIYKTAAAKTPEQKLALANQIARRDIASPADAQEQAKLGDAWWDLAQSRAGQDRTLCLARAGFWYQKAAARMPAGLLRIRTEKRLADLRAEHSAL
jgi:hypothetical protein